MVRRDRMERHIRKVHPRERSVASSTGRKRKRKRRTVDRPRLKGGIGDIFIQPKRTKKIEREQEPKPTNERHRLQSKLDGLLQSLQIAKVKLISAVEGVDAAQSNNGFAAAFQASNDFQSLMQSIIQVRQEMLVAKDRASIKASHKLPEGGRGIWVTPQGQTRKPGSHRS
jgi:hypothetical protein